MTGSVARFGRDRDSIEWGFAEHLKFTLGVDRYTATDHDRFMALAYAVRDRLIDQWMHTQQTHHREDAKRVYYLSLEFLIGRSMGNNVINLGIEDVVRDALHDLGYEFEEIREEEVDAGLGNGGLGRLAACFMDSLATLGIPAFGYGLRYDYGIFRQGLENGYQVEHPDDWLRNGNPWEIERPDVTVPVGYEGHVQVVEENGGTFFRWAPSYTVIGLAYDMPIVGYRDPEKNTMTVNTLRLWSARAHEEFDFQDFNEGEYVEAVSHKVQAENLTKVLYPNDRLYLGRELRLRQQYFFVACSISDIIRRFKKSNRPFADLPDLAAIQLNDTHPALAVPELMRVLVDNERVAWEQAWHITVNTLGYTNHTLMPEALEKWPVDMLQRLLPRHLQIIFAINHEFLKVVSIRYPGDARRLAEMSLIEEHPAKQVRMAYMSIVGSHSTNGVAALHTQLLQERLVPQLAQMFPDRFNNKTNGITQRRFLLKSNPPLAKLITDTIGDAWIRDLDHLVELKPYADDAAFQQKFGEVKLDRKQFLAWYLHREHGWVLNTDSLFDVQVKRIHEYKRQLLNAIHIIILYNRIRNRQTDKLVPRTFMIGGKAAPGYRIAKLIIKLINNIASVVNRDPMCRELLTVHFLPNYRVSLAERVIPAANVSEQISTAGTEASGTGNMKFMCNGAITLGTLDGANIEIRDEAGEDNVTIFGLTAEEVEALRPNYRPIDYYRKNDEIREALDLLFSGHFNFGEPGVFEPIRRLLLEDGDHYMHLADLESYTEAHEQLASDWRDQKRWARRAIMNVATSGKFSADRTIREYARDVWKVNPVAVPVHDNPADTIADAHAENDEG